MQMKDQVYGDRTPVTGIHLSTWEYPSNLTLLIGTLEPEEEDVRRQEDETRRRNLLKKTLSSPVADLLGTPSLHLDAQQQDEDSRRRDLGRKTDEKRKNSWFQLARGQDAEDL